MFNFGIGEMVLIAVILLVVVGPERLPKLMKTVGKTMRSVRQAGRDLRTSVGIDEMMREDFDLRRPPPPRIPPPAPGAVSREQESASQPQAPPPAGAGSEPPAVNPSAPPPEDSSTPPTNIAPVVPPGGRAQGTPDASEADREGAKDGAIKRPKDGAIERPEEEAPSDAQEPQHAAPKRVPPPDGGSTG